MMELKTFLSVVVVLYLFGQSDECTFIIRGPNANDPKPDLISECIEGRILMQYPKGIIYVTFPWSLLPEETRWAKVCLKKIGQGVFSATDITKGYNQTMDFSRSNGARYYSVFDWVCTKSHLIETASSWTRFYPIGSKGIQLALDFGERVLWNLMVIQYKMEEAERP
ncbi:hypothetical protein ACJMK2_021648 [Sinanodonta woodiana]|uniref:Uncharacterized protein n=1 Tax=Sinanodonta woodiana TaxID=1069815 RepID=A0ABD3THW7_SINWO